MVALLLYILREVLGMVKMKRGLVRKAVIVFRWWWRVRFYGCLSLRLVARRGLYELARMAGGEVGLGYSVWDSEASIL